ncbi:uncharacterized protein LOC126995225 [Eriocheir sinensis]|uniref:uncharacterized protein LOC126995225 n=1 Tax=Eriocheir sinensis TaxID=95602 RepID=UPI0021C936E5|nr:uncharacterized protein LOC126995225 [Eriocheir sinensis]
MTPSQNSQTIQQENLKSFVAKVKTYDDLLECMEPALSYQFMFERKTSPWEMFEWDQNELQNFKVEAEKIDRVYYVHCTEDELGSDFYVLCRMKYANKHVFVEFAAGCDYTGFDCQGGGEIYITFNATNFFNEALQNLHDTDDTNVLLHALQEDGYHVDAHQESRKERIDSWNNPLTMNFLCHETIKDCRGSCTCCPDVLLKPLINGIDQLIGADAATDNILIPVLDKLISLEE